MESYNIDFYNRNYHVLHVVIPVILLLRAVENKYVIINYLKCVIPLLKI